MRNVTNNLAAKPEAERAKRGTRTTTNHPIMTHIKPHADSQEWVYPNLTKLGARFFSHGQAPKARVTHKKTRCYAGQ
jgi:hypothetical protein